jgi:hypothetical protein
VYIVDIEDLLTWHDQLRVSEHALREAHKEGLWGKDIIYAILNGEIVEHYPERKRVLIAGPIVELGIPVHVICDYADKDEIVAVTVYIPNRPKWLNEQTRGSLVNSIPSQ